MKDSNLRTTVIGSYPLPGWYEYAFSNISSFGEYDHNELVNDAVSIVIGDQLTAGLDVITDGEMSRRDFNLSFYSLIEGLEKESKNIRHFGPPAHDQRGKYNIIGQLKAPNGLGVVADFERLKRLSPVNPPLLKASIPGPYTLSGRILTDKQYSDRYKITESLLPLVRNELEQLIKAGCKEITIDEPSMSCYAYQENPLKFVDIFNRTVESIIGKANLSIHLCFGNYKGRAVSPRVYKPMFPSFIDMKVDEIHVEMASREFSELEIIEHITKYKNVAVGIVDVKSYFIESVEEISARVSKCLQFAPPERLSFAPDCGLSQTARWAAKEKLKNMVSGVKKVKDTL
jgi:5-methyltetrahydropteroyltriglutamate--homocysteine methyltransferase